MLRWRLGSPAGRGAVSQLVAPGFGGLSLLGGRGGDEKNPAGTMSDSLADAKFGIGSRRGGSTSNERAANPALAGACAIAGETMPPANAIAAINLARARTMSRIPDSSNRHHP